ncbi:hypothetical protein BGZ63DRAFT_169861 [Mariannaea sp. PMI_226]|nr:hypothetical protein BGZ63DRAFT_169861 [Mariannaea sp. PMI_226]
MTAMALPSLDDVQKIFATDAIYDVEDAIIGEKMDDMQKRGMRIESEDGLDFFKDNVLGDKRVRHFLHALFPRSGLGIYEVFRWRKKRSGLIYSFMTGQLPRSAVVVQLWAPNSRMVYYQGSHLLPIQGFPASIGLLEIPYPPLRQCKPVEIDMTKGGL